jgi:hypothetical protein
MRGEVGNFHTGRRGRSLLNITEEVYAESGRNDRWPHLIKKRQSLILHREQTGKPFIGERTISSREQKRNENIAKALEPR